MAKLTERELRDYKVSHTRFMELVNDPTVIVGEITVDYNDYGEFMFVKLWWNEPGNSSGLEALTFFNLGEHESSGRIYDDKHPWEFYHSYVPRRDDLGFLLKERAIRQINERVEQVRSWPKPSQDARQRAFAFLVDTLGDEDGVTSELEDIDWLYGPGYIDELFGGEDDEF